MRRPAPRAGRFAFGAQGCPGEAAGMRPSALTWRLHLTIMVPGRPLIGRGNLAWAANFPANWELDDDPDPAPRSINPAPAGRTRHPLAQPVQPDRSRSRPGAKVLFIVRARRA